jgi:hypothetical protein
MTTIPSFDSLLTSINAPCPIPSASYHAVVTALSCYHSVMFEVSMYHIALMQCAK